MQSDCNAWWGGDPRISAWWEPLDGGADAKTLELALTPRTCDATIAFDFRKLLDKKGRLSVFFRLGDDRRAIPLGNWELTPRNFGWIVSVPIASEIFAQVNDWNPRDQEARGRLPISYAFPLNGAGSYAALTFPVTISGNARGLFDFSQLGSLQLGLSAIGKVDGGPDDEAVFFALSVGLDVRQFFSLHYSYAPARAAARGNQFLMVGFAPTALRDLVGW